MLSYKFNPNLNATYTKRKKSVFCNFLNHEVLIKIGKRLTDYQEYAQYHLSQHRVYIQEIQKLQEKNRNFLTAIIFIIENFEKRSDIVNAVRWPRPIYIHASLLHMRRTLYVVGKLLHTLEKYEKKLQSEKKNTFIALYFEKRINHLKTRILSDLKFIAISFNEFDKEYEISDIFRDDLVQFSLKKEEIQVGDVILWYKGEAYLKNDFYSKLISIAEQSHITHTSIVSHVSKKNVEHINPDNLNENLEIHNEILEIPENVILFIMRPVLNPSQKNQFLHELALLKDEIESRKKIYRFPTFKIWYAGLIGYLYMSLIKYFHLVFIMKNIFKQENTIYCGELIDMLFKRVGIYLLPRSEYDSIIGPSELLFSPYLKFVGAMYNQDEIQFVKSEDYLI